MELMIIGIVLASVSASLGVVAGIDWVARRRQKHVRRLEKQNSALHAHLEVARARMRNLSERRYS